MLINKKMTGYISSDKPKTKQDLYESPSANKTKEFITPSWYTRSQTDKTTSKYYRTVLLKRILCSYLVAVNLLLLLLCRPFINGIVLRVQLLVCLRYADVRISAV